jgi:hypothetical protein
MLQTVWNELDYCVDVCTITKGYNRPLTLLALSVCMRPNFQGLLWDEFGGLGEDELKILFLVMS